MFFQNLFNDKRKLTCWGMGFAAVTFLSVNVISGALFTNKRLDLTEDRVFTISDGTKRVLGDLHEPINLRFYYSSSLETAAPTLKPHIQRVSELLDEYERRADGKLKITRFDPLPFSKEEDLAVADGISAISMRGDQTAAYFGLAAENSTDDNQSIAYFSPERSHLLEYDLTRVIHDLANPEKPVVGLIGEFPLNGDQTTGYRPQAVLQNIEESFEVKTISGDFNTIDGDIDVLMLAQPGLLDEEKQYAVDQFAMRGGRILAFVDPFAETMQTRPGAPAPDAVEATAPLLKSWGVKLAGDKVIGDQQQAVRVRAQVQGRTTAIEYLPWISAQGSNLSQTDIVTADLEAISLNSAGSIEALADATTTIEPLLKASSDSQAIDLNEIRFGPDPAKLLADFVASGEVHNFAVRISGPAKSTFGSDLPKSLSDNEELKAKHMEKSNGDLNVILVADVDILSDRNWVSQQELLGARIAVPFADNGDFTINALENLSGAEGLIALRSRGVTDRPFDVIANMQKSAEQKFRAKEQELLAKIDETANKIRNLQEEEKKTGVILTATQEREVADFQAAMIDMRQELRDVQRSLREDVDGLKGTIKAANIWGVPALLVITTLGLTAYRRKKTTRNQLA